MHNAWWRILIIWICTIHQIYSQNQLLDSLIERESKYSDEDSIRCKLLIDIGRGLLLKQTEQSFLYLDKAVLLAEKLQNGKLLTNAISAKGTAYYYLRKFAFALSEYEKALAINQKMGNEQGVANNYNNLGLVYQATFQYPKSLECFLKTLSLNEKTGNQPALINALGNIGNIYNELSEYQKAKEYYEKALSLTDQIKSNQALSGILTNLGNAHTQLEEYDIALVYKMRSLELSRQANDSNVIAINLGNIANVYLLMGVLDKALSFYQEGLAMYQKLKDDKGKAEMHSGLTEAYLRLGKYDLAKTNAYIALQLSKTNQLYNIESTILNNLSKIFKATQNFDSAYYTYQLYINAKQKIDNAEIQREITKTTLLFEFSKTEDSLRQQQLITKIQLNEQLLISEKQKQEIKLKQNAIDLSKKEREIQKIQIQKSQADLELAQSQNKIKEEQLLTAEKDKKLQASLVDLQKAELEVQKVEIQTQKNQKLFLYSGMGLLAILSFSFYRNFINQKKSKIAIESEKNKSESLLHNILPFEIAQELKTKGETTAKRFNEVTVLFSDFVDFTKVAEKLSPEELVQELHLCFSQFDIICTRYGLEKIKTIGDAYMAVAGLPVESKFHAENAAKAALEMVSFMQQRLEKNPYTFRIRMGLHSGPVVAGVVGVKKFAFDIWGDTVNTASRMETASEPGKINVSEITAGHLSPVYNLSYRGKMPAKNKGEIDMYFLLDKK
ncbi:MAG: tetratricopeptide repeat protein [Saprospiraceae bacterium]|nr:tetratricopeptide repeat protein [Saprospiraceae bacterium]